MAARRYKGLVQNEVTIAGSNHPSQSKNLWFRMAVPGRLRAKVGKREIKFSLETSDPQEAKIRQAREQARWRSYFQGLEAELECDAVATAPAIVDAFLEEMGRRNGALANVIFGFQTTISMRLFIAWGRDEFSQRRVDWRSRSCPAGQLGEAPTSAT